MNPSPKHALSTALATLAVATFLAATTAINPIVVASSLSVACLVLFLSERSSYIGRLKGSGVVWTFDQYRGPLNALAGGLGALVLLVSHRRGAVLVTSGAIGLAYSTGLFYLWRAWTTNGS